MARRGNDSKTEIAQAIFIGIPRPIRLEAEVSQKYRERFQKEYTTLTGSIPQPGTESYHEMHPGKWGRELRIYFNADQRVVGMLRSLGFHVEEEQPYRTEYRYRINNNKIWWKLVEAGFKLGDNP